MIFYELLWSRMCSSSSCTGGADLWQDPEDLFARLKWIFHSSQTLTRRAFHGQPTTQMGRMKPIPASSPHMALARLPGIPTVQSHDPTGTPKLQVTFTGRTMTWNRAGEPPAAIGTPGKWTQAQRWRTQLLSENAHEKKCWEMKYKSRGRGDVYYFSQATPEAAH